MWYKGSRVDGGKAVLTPVSESSAFNQLPSSAQLSCYQRWGRFDPNKTTDRADWNMRYPWDNKHPREGIWEWFLSVCSDGRTKVSQRKLARRQVQKNQISFSSHLHCCSLQDAVEASNFTWFQKEKELSKFMEMKRIIISTQSYYSSTAPGSGSFPLQNSGTVFWGDCLVLLQLLMEKRQWTEFLIWAGPATLIS